MANPRKKVVDEYIRNTIKKSEAETHHRANKARKKAHQTNPVAPIGTPLYDVEQIARSAWELTYGLTGSYVADREDHAHRFTEHDNELHSHDSRIKNVELLDKRLHEMIAILLHKQDVVRIMWDMLAEQLQEKFPDFYTVLNERYPDMEKKEQEITRLIKKLRLDKDG